MPINVVELFKICVFVDWKINKLAKLLFSKVYRQAYAFFSALIHLLIVYLSLSRQTLHVVI